MNTVKIKNGTKLGDVISFLPNGVINKTVTGIGATTLEAVCKRNSIIVEPTRAIVADKSRIHQCLGFMNGVTENDVREYLSRVKNEFRKIFVVSDSVGKLITILKDQGEDVFTDYHYLVDEAEQYQTEASYRLGMGIAIDYYKVFPAQNRTLTSAFLYKFSNPFFAAEPLTTYAYETPIQRNITLKVTNHSILEAISTLKSLTGKTLIFFNSIEGINNIIELGELDKKECAVHCGDSSKDKVLEYYKSFATTPTHRYNFYTSAYFSGVDIKGDYNLITVVDTTKIHTLLPPSKIKQIAGRVRNPLVNDIIITSYSPNLYQEYSDYIEERVKDAEKAKQVIDANRSIEGNIYFDSIRKAVLKEDFDGVVVTREDKDGNIVPNYEEIDSKYLHIRSGTQLYSNPTGLRDYLKAENHNILFSESSYSYSQDQINQMNAYREKMDEEKEQAVEMVYALVKAEEAKGPFNFDTMDFRQLMYQSTGITRKLLEFYLKYRDVEALKKLKGDEKLMRKYGIAKDFIMLSSNHGYKRKLVEALPVGVKFLREEAAEVVNRINAEELPELRPMNTKQAIKHIKRFFKTKRPKITVGIDERIDGIEIVGLLAA